MYVFGVVLSDADETPIGRSSVALTELGQRKCRRLSGPKMMIRFLPVVVSARAL
jgi:hypothetical protein